MCQNVYPTTQVMFVWRNHCGHGTAVNIKYLALVIRHAMRMRHIALPSVACQAVPYFSTVSHKEHTFLRKKLIQHKMCFFISYTTFVWNISRSEKNSSRYCHKCSKVSVYSTGRSCEPARKLEFSRQNFEKKNPQIPNFMKIRQWEPRSSMRMSGQPDGRTAGRADMTKLIVALRDFPQAASTGYLHEYLCMFMIISRSILLRMRNVSDKSCRENQNTHFCFLSFFPKIVPFVR
jgi:hypothetical protein